VRLAPNPAGSRDETITLLLARDSDGVPLFVLWNYACHPVAFPEPRMVAAHFPHVVRDRLREEWHLPALPVLFLQGFSGDTRPSASGLPQSSKQRVRDLLVGARFHDMSWRSYRSWTRSLADLVVEATSQASLVETRSLVTSRTVRAASDFVIAEHTLEPVSFHGLRVGADLALVGVSAEVVSDYARILREEHPGVRLMLGGCLDHPFGYVPTGVMLAEGGYEASGYCSFFGVRTVRKDVQESLLEGLSGVLVQLLGVESPGDGDQA
jgi:hypothetical protein